MSIVIIEGCDFSGKTTLAREVAKRLNGFLVSYSFKPHNLGDIEGWMKAVIQMSSVGFPVICDRTPLISEPIYGNIIRKSSRLTNPEPFLRRLFPYGTVIVYCDPGWDIVSKCDNDQMEGVKENLEAIYREYQLSFPAWKLPTAQYDRTNLEEVMTFVRRYSRCGDYETLSVMGFHDKFNIPFPSEPALPTRDVLEFRMAFLQEEISEILKAYHGGDLTGFFDGLLDLVYVAKGTALLTGITPDLWLEGFNAVHEANMTKLRAPSSEHSKRSHYLDVIKPPGFIGPEGSLKRILEK